MESEFHITKTIFSICFYAEKGLRFESRRLLCILPVKEQGIIRAKKCFSWLSILEGRRYSQRKCTPERAKMKVMQLYCQTPFLQSGRFSRRRCFSVLSFLWYTWRFLDRTSQWPVFLFKRKVCSRFLSVCQTSITDRDELLVTRPSQ